MPSAGPPTEKAPASRTRPLTCFQSLTRQCGGNAGDGVAGQRGVARSLDVEDVIAVEEESGREAVVGAEGLQGGQAGHQFDGRGRGEGDVPVVRTENHAVGGYGVAAMADQPCRPGRSGALAGKTEQEGNRQESEKGERAAIQGHDDDLLNGKMLPLPTPGPAGGTAGFQIFGRLAIDLAISSSGYS